MVEKLLQIGKITQEQFELYMLFQANELGRKTLAGMTHSYLIMEEPPMDYAGQGFAYQAGRCSVIRDVHRTIMLVQKLLQEFDQ